MRKRRLLGTAAAIAGAAALLVLLVRPLLPGDGPRPPAGAEPRLVHEQDGRTYALFEDGNVYVRSSPGDAWAFAARFYEPGYREQHYVEKDGRVHRRDPETGRAIPMRRTFSDDFEGARTVRDLVGEERGWTAFTLLSPRTPSVEDYVRLRKEVLRGGGFLDNRLDLAAGPGEGASTALACLCAPPGPGMVCSKASLSTELVHFVRGDHVWFRARYFAARGTPFTLADLESTWIHQHPGMRVTLWGGRHLGMELKWMDKPEYRQPPGREIPFPSGRWVEVRFHLLLSHQEDGLVELWQDGQRLLRSRGRTLPLPEAVYNDLEVGVSALCSGPEALLYVDDVRIAPHPAD